MSTTPTNAAATDKYRKIDKLFQGVRDEIQRVVDYHLTVRHAMPLDDACYPRILIYDRVFRRDNHVNMILRADVNEFS